MLWNRSILSALSFLILVLTACAKEPVKKNQHAALQAGKFDQSATEFVNRTIFPGSLIKCQGECSQNIGQDFYAWNIKVTFDIDKNDELSISQQQEPALTNEDDVVQDALCGEKGSTGNQRNAWFPYTGIFVYGGDIDAIKYTGTEPMTLFALSEIEGGQMMVINENKERVEWAFFPCVGPKRVDRGYRLNSFLPRGSVLVLTSESGVKRELGFPSPDETYVLLRYRSGAMIPVPMRPVIVTIDLVGGKLVVYYQTTFAVSPPLRKVELKALLSDQGPTEGETEDEFQTRRQAIINDLNNCPVPEKPIENCANPNRRPNWRIYSLK